MKITATIVAFIVLFQSFNFDIEDINKVPNFINDISCHINAGENFSNFIADHYIESSETHEHSNDLHSHKHDDHGELPFKHQHADNHFQLVYMFFTQAFENPIDDFIIRNSNFNYKEPSTNLFTNSFFQPPQV